MLRSVAAIVAVLLSASACSKKSEDAPPAKGVEPQASAAANATAEGEVDPRTHGSRVARRMQVPRLALLKIEVAEVAPMMPEVKGAVALGEPMLQASGRQVRQSFCYAESDLNKIGAEVRKAMEARGFNASTPQPRGKPDRPRIAVSGQKDDWRLNANILASANQGCKDKSEVLFTFHRIVKPDPSQMPPPLAPTTPAAPAQ